MSYRMGVPSRNFDALKFTCYNAEEIRNISVMEVTNPRSLNFLLSPTEKGLYDPLLGPPTPLDNCNTCGQGSIQCPGHLSHIELPLPVYHPVFFQTMHLLLRGSCLTCHIILLNRSQLVLLFFKLQALNNGLYQLTNDLEEKYRLVVQEADTRTIETSGLGVLQDELEKLYNAALSKRNKSREANYFSKNAMELRRVIVKEFFKQTSSKTKCGKCGNAPTYTRVEQNCKIFFGESLTPEERKLKIEPTQHYVTPVEARDHLSKLWENEGVILRAIFGALHDVALEESLVEENGGGLIKSTVFEYTF